LVGVLRGNGPELIVLGAHHATAPDARRLRRRGGGRRHRVARALAKGAARAHIVFAS
jgi:hypothetical protein